MPLLFLFICFCFSQVRWYPYIIDLGTKAGGEPYLAYNKRRWGSDGWVAGMKSEGRGDGALFKRWGRGASAADLQKSVWANTLNAHCLLHLAKDKYGWPGMHKLKQRLLEEYYEANQNISLIDVLVQIWGALFPGKDSEKEARNYLESRTGEQAVLSLDAQAKKRGVSGVPSFRVSFRLGDKDTAAEHDWVGVDKEFSGAQPHTMWSNLFTEIQMNHDE